MPVRMQQPEPKAEIRALGVSLLTSHLSPSPLTGTDTPPAPLTLTAVDFPPMYRLIEGSNDYSDRLCLSAIACSRRGKS